MFCASVRVSPVLPCVPQSCQCDKEEQHVMSILHNSCIILCLCFMFCASVSVSPVLPCVPQSCQCDGGSGDLRGLERPRRQTHMLPFTLPPRSSRLTSWLGSRFLKEPRIGFSSMAMTFLMYVCDIRMFWYKFSRIDLTACIRLVYNCTIFRCSLD